MGYRMSRINPQPFERKQNRFKLYACSPPQNDCQVIFWAWQADFRRVNSKNDPDRMDRGKGKVIVVLAHMAYEKKRMTAFKNHMTGVA